MSEERFDRLEKMLGDFAGMFLGQLKEFQQEVNQRFERVEHRLDQLEQGMREINIHMTRTDARVDTTVQMVSQVDRRVVTVELGMYRVDCMERRQNKAIVQLDCVDAEVNFLKEQVFFAQV